MEVQVRCRCGKRLFDLSLDRPPGGRIYILCRCKTMNVIDLSAYSNLQAHSVPVSKEAPEPTSQRQASAQS